TGKSQRGTGLSNYCLLPRASASAIRSRLTKQEGLSTLKLSASVLYRLPQTAAKVSTVRHSFGRTAAGTRPALAYSPEKQPPSPDIVRKTGLSWAKGPNCRTRSGGWRINLGIRFWSKVTEKSNL